MQINHLELNRLLAERLGFPISPLQETSFNVQRTNMIAQGLDPQRAEDVLYSATIAAKASAETKFAAMSAAGKTIIGHCNNCGTDSEFPDYLYRGNCATCGNGIPLTDSPAVVSAPPAIAEVVCAKCGGINQVPNRPPLPGHTYACTVCHAHLSTTDPHQSYVDRHNEIAGQQQSWQVAGGLIVILGFISTIMYSCRAPH